ncbi:MAG: DUF4860 domain-containing protein [Erysipelotrichaceae bacterium]
MNRNGYRNLFMLLLITLYVAGTGFVVLYGASFYRQMVTRSAQDLQVRTALSYFNNRLKQNDEQGMIEVRTEEKSLVFKEDGFYILVYEDNGYLVEQNSLTSEIMPGASQKIAQVSKLSFVIEGNFLAVHFIDANGKTYTLNYVLMSKGALS